MPVRVVRVVRVTLFAASSLYLVFIVLSNHAMRASMIPVRTIVDSSFFALRPQALATDMHFENYGLLDDFRNDLPDTLRTGDLASSIQIMEWLGDQFSRAEMRALVPESPRRARRFLIERKQRGACYNDAILFSTYLQSIGLYSRVLALDGFDGMGGSGHNVTEVWSEEHTKWVMFDQQQVAFFTLTQTSIPASAFEVRQAALQGEEYFNSHLGIHQSAGFVVPHDQLWELYCRGVDFNVLASSNLYTAIEDQPIRQLAEWVELQAGTFGKPALWVGRLIRSAFGTPFIRFRYKDAATPEYGFDSWYVAYRVAVPIWLISGMLVFFSAVRRRSRFGGIEYWMRTGSHSIRQMETLSPEAPAPLPPQTPTAPSGRIPPPVL